MAPEVINTQKQGYNSKVDIWSLGCLILEMWTGVRPWAGLKARDVILKVWDFSPSLSRMYLTATH